MSILISNWKCMERYIEVQRFRKLSQCSIPNFHCNRVRSLVKHKLKVIQIFVDLSGSRFDFKQKDRLHQNLNRIRTINFFLIFFLGCSLWRDMLIRGIFFWQKGDLYFLIERFLLRNCQNLSVFQSNFTSNSFRIRNCSDPDPDPDPA